MGQRSLTTLHPERASLVVTVISDNDFSATVVSYQKKGSGSHFVPFSLHVILSIVIYDRAEGRVCLPFSLLVFSPLLFQYPWPRRPLVTSHTRSPLGRAPGFTLGPGIFVIPGDFSFVLLCTHRAPGSSRPACFRKRLTSPSSYWAFVAFALRMRELVEWITMRLRVPRSKWSSGGSHTHNK
jgi:hypothetical protein